MDIQIKIGFDQLVKIVKSLSSRQFKQLIMEVEAEKKSENSKLSLEELLLAGPVATKEQLEVIESNRKMI